MKHKSKFLMSLAFLVPITYLGKCSPWKIGQNLTSSRRAEKSLCLFIHPSRKEYVLHVSHILKSFEAALELSSDSFTMHSNNSWAGILSCNQPGVHIQKHFKRLLKRNFFWSTTSAIHFSNTILKQAALYNVHHSSLSALLERTVLCSC